MEKKNEYHLRQGIQVEGRGKGVGGTTKHLDKLAEKKNKYHLQQGRTEGGREGVERGKRTGRKVRLKAQAETGREQGIAERQKKSSKYTFRINPHLSLSTSDVKVIMALHSNQSAFFFYSYSICRTLSAWFFILPLIISWFHLSLSTRRQSAWIRALSQGISGWIS